MSGAGVMRGGGEGGRCGSETRVWRFDPLPRCAGRLIPETNKNACEVKRSFSTTIHGHCIDYACIVYTQFVDSYVHP